MPKPLGLERKPGYWDRHRKRWIYPGGKGENKRDSMRPAWSGEFVPFNDSRTVKCPICGEMVHYAIRRLHSCHYEYMKQIQADTAEFEAGMVMAIHGGRKSWEQYG